jgi:hypothetical protein
LFYYFLQILRTTNKKIDHWYSLLWRIYWEKNFSFFYWWLQTHEKLDIPKWVYHNLWVKFRFTLLMSYFVPTFDKLFQNPINISIKEETNQIIKMLMLWNEEKQKIENKKQQKEKRIQDVVEVVSSNTFASIQQVSEDNLKEFLVLILCLCIQIKKSKWESLSNEKRKERELKQTNKLTEWEFQLVLDQCQCEVHIEKQFHKQQPLFNSY